MSSTQSITQLAELPGSEIDTIPKDSRLAPEPEYDPDDIDGIADLAELMQGLPRSQRVQIAFDWRPTDYQTLVLDYGEEVARAQVAPKKGRQVGATETAGKIGADAALHAGQTDILYTAPGQDTADEMFDEFKDSFKQGPLTLEQYGVTKDNERTWKFDSGCRAMSRTLGAVGQDDNPGNRGLSPTVVIVDEAAYEQDKVYTEEIEEFFITHPEYEYYLFSTPAGQSGYFYGKAEVDGIRDYETAVDTDWGWYAPYWPTKISPFAQQDYIEKKREELDSQTFDQEFLGYFAKDGDSAIPHSTLVPNLKPDRERDPAQPRYLGVDPARSGKDEMVAFDLDAEGVCWNVWTFETISGPQFVEFLECVHTDKTELEYLSEYPTPETGAGTTPSKGYETILIEENGVGGFAADFAEAGLGSVIKVVTTSNKSKQDVYQRLIKDLESTALALPKHDKLVRQTTKLQKSFTPTGLAKYSHPTGEHDDWPDGLAFANYARHGGGERLAVNAKQNKFRAF